MNETHDIKKISIALEKEVSNKVLLVEGEVPDWLNGTFVRNGPISVEIGDQKLAHWFDGLAMLHAFSFQKNKVTYTNQFLKTDAYKTVFVEGSLQYLGFDSLPPHPIWDNIKHFFNPPVCPPLQNANVNIAEIDHQFIALTETPLPVQFDLKTLDTIGAVQFQDNLPKENAFDSAHMQYDRKTGEKINYLVDFGIRSQYVVYRYNQDVPKREVIGKIPVKNPAYMHSFALTEHYIILVEFPFIVNPFDLLFMTKPFIANYYWCPDKGTNFLIINRKTGCLEKTIKDCNPFFAFHHVNAYEEGDNIVLDIVTYPNANVISNISQHGFLSTPYGSTDEKLNETKLMRYRLSLSDGILQSKILFDKSFELPRINEQHNARPYRYAYGSDQRPLLKPTDIRPIYKIDTKNRETLAWKEPGMLPGEPVFVPKPHTTDEDEGVILSIILDPVHKKSFLLILDGKTLTEKARIYTPFPIPVGLHGQFFYQGIS